MRERAARVLTEGAGVAFRGQWNEQADFNAMTFLVMSMMDKMGQDLTEEQVDAVYAVAEETFVELSEAQLEDLRRRAQVVKEAMTDAEWTAAHDRRANRAAASFERARRLRKKGKINKRQERELNRRAEKRSDREHERLSGL